MKTCPTYKFRDQVSTVTEFFKSWNECEQTVALYSLMRILKPTQARFLMQVIEHGSATELAEVQVAEHNANDPEYISALRQQSKEQAVASLLALLPLLRPESVHAKHEFLNILPKILTHSFEHGMHIEESRQLLSYSLIHPAMSSVDRAQFKLWLLQLEQHLDETRRSHKNGITVDADAWHHELDTSGGALQQQMCGYPGSMHLSEQNGHRKLTRHSTTPTATPLVNDWLNKHHDELLTAPPPPPLSPQSSVASSNSDTIDPSEHQQLQQETRRNTFLDDSSGMRDVPIWLKSLRLHKYAYLFQQMTYDEMLHLTEDWLASQNVTKGARNKIILSIQKLQGRSAQLQAMEKDIMESGNLKQALNDIKALLNTPIKPCRKPETAVQIVGSQDDLPGQLTRVIGKLCTQLLVTSRPDDESLGLYLQLLDKALAHDAFSAEQKKKLATWKQQIHKNWHPPPAPAKYALDRQRKSFGSLLPNLLAMSPVLRANNGGQRALRGATTHKPPPPAPPPQHANWSAFSGMQSQVGAITPSMLAAGMQPVYRPPYSARPHSYEVKQAVTRTHSAPIAKSSPYLALARTATGGGSSAADMSVTEPELTARLDSLCLRMTEAALGSTNDGSGDKGCMF